MRERSIPYYTLSESVDEFFGSAMGSNRKYYENYLVNAKWVWKKLFRDTLFDIKTKYLPIDKTTNPHSVVFPKNVQRIFGASLISPEGDVVQLHENERMNTSPLPTGRQCSCKECECTSEFCGVVEQFSIRTRDIVINGQTYTERIWNKKCANGDIIEIRQTPLQDFISQNNWRIIYKEHQRTICSLDVKPCGCLNANEFNSEWLKKLNLLFRDNPCGVDDEWAERLFHDFDSHRGEFNVNLKTGRVYLRHIQQEANFVMLSYQDNGECSYEEIMVPETAMDALHTGMIWRIAAMSGKPRLEVREAKRQYSSEVTELEQFLQPVSMKEFIDVQGHFHIWGTGHQRKVKHIVSKLPPMGVSRQEVCEMISTKFSQVIITASGSPCNQCPEIEGQFAYVHYQDVAATVWHIDATRNGKGGLSFWSNATIVDIDGNKIEADQVHYIDMNHIDITFSKAITGYVYLS